MVANKRRARFAAITIAILAMHWPLLGQESVQDLAESVHRFADYLVAEGDYLRAAAEYRRYLFLSSANTTSTAEEPALRESLQVRLRMGQCYVCGGLPEAAREHLDAVLNAGSSSELQDLRRSAAYTIGYSLMQMGDFQGAIAALSVPLVTGDREAAFLAAVNHALLADWPAVIDTVTPIATDAAASGLLELARSADSTERKRPFVAGLLSAFLPGVGKMYAGEAADGLFSLTSIGLLGGLTYLGFSQDGIRSVRGWTYGSLGALFYLGNIYGSVQSARRTNERLDEAYRSDARRFVPPCRVE
jgi:TM2 domain-containing membrane protein YozV